MHLFRTIWNYDVGYQIIARLYTYIFLQVSIKKILKEGNEFERIVYLTVFRMNVSNFNCLDFSFILLRISKYSRIVSMIFFNLDCTLNRC